ncbi:MAG: type VI secretion system baseplate subunit TssF [Myxococcota bacterium]
MLNRYFQDELDFFRDLSREFAREHPTLAPALAEASSDPDVERILEGTAFLTAAVRQKLEDDLPELTQTLLQMLWPHYLRPVPSTTIVEFGHPSRAKISGRELLPRSDVQIDSVPVDGTPCRFRTSYDVAFRPLRIASAQIEPEGRGRLRLGVEIMGGASLDDLALDSLRLYLHGDLPFATSLYLWLMRHVSGVALECADEGRTRRVELPRHPSPLRAVGFAEDEALLPYPKHSFPGYRLLQEYFTLPQKFLFVDVTGLDALASLAPTERFDLVFQFDERPPDGMRVAPDNIRLHCTPVVNLQERDAEPIRLDQKRSSYLVRPDDPEPSHLEVYSVDRVTGINPGTARRHVYPSFFAFRSGVAPESGAPTFYKLQRRNAVGVPNSSCYLSFVNAEEGGTVPEAEVVSIELTCTNRRLAEGLRPGDVCRHTEHSPQFAEFRNLLGITPSVLPPLEGGFHWRLISHLSLNFVSLADAEALRSLLSLYDFAALHDRQAAMSTRRRLESIQGVETKPGERLFRGAAVRGVETTIQLAEDRFSSDGEVFLFARLLEEFLSLYVTVNSFSQLTVVGTQKGERYEWPPRIGSQFTL